MLALKSKVTDSSLHCGEHDGTRHLHLRRHYPHPNGQHCAALRRDLGRAVADDTGLHVFGVGEHHRLDLPISSPAVVMAAIAVERNHLSYSAVTILSTLDPVRVFQDFATVDLLVGRAELIASCPYESFCGDRFADNGRFLAKPSISSSKRLP